MHLRDTQCGEEGTEDLSWERDRETGKSKGMHACLA